MKIIMENDFTNYNDIKINKFMKLHNNSFINL